MSLFSKPFESADEHFADLACGTDPRSEQARAHVAHLAARSAPFLDGDFLHRLQQSFQQGYWEALLCADLLEAQLPVTPRAGRRAHDTGPDLQVGDVESWFEAIAVTPGTGPDAVPKRNTDRVSEVPDAQIKLRLTSALRDKNCKLEGYKSNGLVHPHEPCVVAINAGSVPYAHKELDTPRIVRSVFPIGWPTVNVDTAAGTITDSGFTYRASESKKSGVSVPTDDFLQGAYPVVSAVLYSATTPFSALHHKPGAEIVLVHNPHATAPLPHGYLPIGSEYWLDEAGEQVCRRHHE